MIDNNKKKEKKRIHRMVDFAIPSNHGVKLKESEKRDKYLGLAKELKNWCTDVILLYSKEMHRVLQIFISGKEKLIMCKIFFNQKRNMNILCNNKKILSIYKNGIWDWKMCYAHNIKSGKGSNRRKRTTESRKHRTT